MAAVTLAIALMGAVAALVSGPVGSLLAYFAVMFYYPQAMAVQLGGIGLSSGRIVMLAVIFSALFRGGLRRYKFDLLDLLVVVLIVLEGVAYSTNVDPQRVWVGRGGAFLDVILPYFAVRLLIDDKEKMIRLIKWTAVLLLPLAMLGIFESVSGRNIYSPLAPHFGFGLAGTTLDPDYKRHGLYRASSSFGNYISFGMLFAAWAPLALGLLHDKRWGKFLALAVTGALLGGLMSSMSSGPLFSIAVTLGMTALFKWRDRWPLFAVVTLAAIVFVEVFSNRHFYYVLTLFAFDPETAYYRIGLIEECFGGGMSGHWMFGYGYVGVGPGNDNLAAGFRWDHQDLTNIYVRLLAQTGLVATIPYLIINLLFYLRLYRASKYVNTKRDAWLLWCFAAMLVGWNIAMMTVSAMAQIQTLLFMFIGWSANWPQVMRREALARQAAAAGAARPESPAGLESVVSAGVSGDGDGEFKDREFVHAGAHSGREILGKRRRGPWVRRWT